MPTNTYVALDKVTVGTATSTITFSGISGSYTDLVIVGNWGQSVDAESCLFRVGNGSVDTGTNYSATELYGTGSAAGSQRTTNATGARITFATGGGSAVTSNFQLHLMNYASTTTNKTFITRNNVPSSSFPGTSAFASLWRSTAAINTIQFYLTGGNFLAGSTFSLYGIASSSVGAKAIGGIVTSDDTYYYHTFLASGTLTPTQSISADTLVIAGGGGDVGRFGGGGGAGGLVYSSSQSLTATAYTVTVGAGGVGNANGTNSNITGGALSLTAAIGGGRGGNLNVNGSSGGSGGGGGGSDTGGPLAGGAGTAGQGFAGGSGLTWNGSSGRTGGGGGGAGGIGGSANNTTRNAGVGGVGSSSYSSWGLATGTGQNVSGIVYYAGGGGGGSYQYSGEGVAGAGGYGGGGAGLTGIGSGTNGTANTGGGAGGSGEGASPSNGGSGVVIVRYAK